MIDAPEAEIILDFSSIAFTSRAFLDQLNHEVHQLPKKKVHFANLSEEVTAMLKIVRRRRPKPQADPAVRNAPVIRL
jgi:hypothetical protein